jgi:hypothetical protein
VLVGTNLLKEACSPPARTYSNAVYQYSWPSPAWTSQRSTPNTSLFQYRSKGCSSRSGTFARQTHAAQRGIIPFAEDDHHRCLIVDSSSSSRTLGLTAYRNIAVLSFELVDEHTSLVSILRQRSAALMSSPGQP